MKFLQPAGSPLYRSGSNARRAGVQHCSWGNDTTVVIGVAPAAPYIANIPAVSMGAIQSSVMMLSETDTDAGINQRIFI